MHALNCIACMLMYIYVRLAILQVLRLLPNAVLHAGPVCSSWVFLSRHTTGRTELDPMGASGSPSACMGNLMVARSAPQLPSRGPLANVFAAFAQPLYPCMFAFMHAASLRMALLLHLASARGVMWMLEQPSSSLMFQHPRLQHLCSCMKACAGASIC